MICTLDYQNKSLTFGSYGAMVNLTENELRQLICDENISYLENGGGTKFVSVTIKLLFPDVAHQP